MNAVMIVLCAVWINIQAYTFDDVTRDIVSGRKGIDAVREIALLLEKTSVRYRSDPETEEFKKFVEKTLKNFDFMKVYDSQYMKDQGSGFRALRFQGCNTERSYVINLVTPKNSRCEVSRIWDYSTEYAMKKNDNCLAGGRSFIISVKSTTATKRYSHRNALLFVESLLKVIDPDNIRNLRAPESKLYGAVEGDSRKIINDFYRTFPRVSELFDRYSVIHSFLEVKNYNRVPCTRLNFRYGYRLDNLKKEFPDLAKSLKNIYGLYKINMAVKNSAGHTVLTIVFDSREDALSLSLLTRRGRILPVDASGNPVFGEELALTSMRDVPYYAVLDMTHDVHGLKFITDNMVVRFRFQNSQAQGLWTMKLDDVSKTRITGSYYHIIPTWLINIFIPKNMDQMIYDLSRVMLKGNDGAGSMVIFEWDTRDPGNVMLHFSAISEFMDNYFLKYGLGVWSRKAMEDNNFMKDAKALKEKLITAFKADLKI
jgi:hypothetical protein